jgi:hypothetical protein
MYLFYFPSVFVDVSLVASHCASSTIADSPEIEPQSDSSPRKAHCSEGDVKRWDHK